MWRENEKVPMKWETAPFPKFAALLDHVHAGAPSTHCILTVAQPSRKNGSMLQISEHTIGPLHVPVGSVMYMCSGSRYRSSV